MIATPGQTWQTKGDAMKSTLLSIHYLLKIKYEMSHPMCGTKWDSIKNKRKRN
jgi:hypothetical protein